MAAKRSPRAGKRVVKRSGQPIDPVEPALPADVMPNLRDLHIGPTLDLSADELAAMPRKQERVTVPPPPTQTTNRVLMDEQQVARVEALMLKGFTSPSHLMAMLGVEDRRAMDRYIARANARFEFLGQTNNQRRALGKARARWEEMIQQLNVTIQNTEDGKAKIVAMAMLQRCYERVEALGGLTPKAIERLSMTTDDSEVAMRMQRQANIARISTQIADRIRENREAKEEGIREGAEDAEIVE